MAGFRGKIYLLFSPEGGGGLAGDANQCIPPSRGGCLEAILGRVRASGRRPPITKHSFVVTAASPSGVRLFRFVGFTGGPFPSDGTGEEETQNLADQSHVLDLLPERKIEELS